MMLNPLKSLPGFGEILKNRINFNSEAESRRGGDYIGSVLDYLIGKEMEQFTIFPGEVRKHRRYVTIAELQTFIEWAFHHLAVEMKWDVNEMAAQYEAGVDRFLSGEKGDE